MTNNHREKAGGCPYFAILVLPHCGGGLCIEKIRDPCFQMYSVTASIYVSQRIPPFSVLDTGI